MWRKHLEKYNRWYDPDLEEKPEQYAVYRFILSTRLCTLEDMDHA